MVPDLTVRWPVGPLSEMSLEHRQNEESNSHSVNAATTQVHNLTTENTTGTNIEYTGLHNILYVLFIIKV